MVEENCKATTTLHILATSSILISVFPKLAIAKGLHEIIWDKEKVLVFLKTLCKRIPVLNRDPITQEARSGVDRKSQT
jgi:hypothetical protein